MIRVLVNGARGRMGRLAVQAIRTSGDLELCGETGRGDDLTRAIGTSRAEVVLDFTLPDCVGKNALAIVDAGARPVIGTSGVDAATREELTRRCAARHLGGVIAPNFAVGAVLMMRLAELAARHMSAVEIVESHHAEKKDAPSGTAVATAEKIARARREAAAGATPTPAPAAGAAAGAAARGEVRDGVTIHSLRLPGIVAEQEVIFGEVGQRLSIQHITYGREAYMPGVLLACRKVVALDRLVVGLDELLFGPTQG